MSCKSLTQWRWRRRWSASERASWFKKPVCCKSLPSGTLWRWRRMWWMEMEVEMEEEVVNIKPLTD